jgi:phosphomannomutase
MQIDSTIFKAYDIRGIVPQSLNADVAKALGWAFAHAALKVGEKVVAVGRDGRISGPMLRDALVDGLLSGGVDVIDVGMVTTPMLYFAAHTHCHSGIQITGSHNPKDYNGFKMVLGGRAIYGDEILGLHSYMKEAHQPSGPRGELRHLDISREYSERITGDVKLHRPMKIVVDSGNGIAGAFAPALFRAMGCEVIELFSEVDGNFPNHHPDPSKLENLKDVIHTLATTNAELGLAFDGDGDRLGVVTKDGQTIFPDRQMQLFAKDVLGRVPGGSIVFDVKCSQQLAPAITKFGGQPVMFKTGHSLIKAQMKLLDSPLGGEMSGHIFFKERWYGFDDGTYAGARLLEILSASPDANAVLHALPSSFSTPELNVACTEGEPHKLTQAILERIKSSEIPSSDKNPVICDVDGLRIDWSDGFGLIRASNTTPVLVLRFEGQTQAALARIEKDMMALLYAVKPDATFKGAAH